MTNEGSTFVSHQLAFLPKPWRALHHLLLTVGSFFDKLSDGKHWRWYRSGILIGLDHVILFSSILAATLLHSDGHWLKFPSGVITGLIPIIYIHFAVFIWWGMYRQICRYASFHTVLTIVACTTSSALASFCFLFFFPVAGLPWPVLVIHCAFSTMALAAMRCSWRWVLGSINAQRSGGSERCLVYGAGSGGDLLVRHMLADKRFPFKVVGFIDDSPAKQGYSFHGVKVLGKGKDLQKICSAHGIETVIVAMPSVPGKVLRNVFERCQKARIKPLIMPDMATALGDKVFRPRDIDLHDLLRRSPKSIDHDRVKREIKGRTILISGAGGSIGSEICRQVAQYEPGKMILLDSSEFNLYQIETALLDSGFERSRLVAVLGSVTSHRVVDRLFIDHKPSLVLHAAANKHVSLLERNPLEGIINNVLGTKVLLEAASRSEVDRFLLISSDKAVRPTSVMGATKRVCELMTQAMNHLSSNGCRYFSVRFGNVIGSSGSVIPRFINQIRAGGPVTVTHPDVTRFFMLTSEAVALVLQAVTMARGGETFVLNMGEPVRIQEMAHQLIRLMGKEPGKDVEIAFTGLGAGEKLHEELILTASETHTLHDDIFVATPAQIDPPLAMASADRLLQLAREGDAELCTSYLRHLASDRPAPVPIEPISKGSFPLSSAVLESPDNLAEEAHA